MDLRGGKEGREEAGAGRGDSPYLMGRPLTYLGQWQQNVNRHRQADRFDRGSFGECQQTSLFSPSLGCGQSS